MLRDYDAMVPKLYAHFLNRQNACESFISMTLLADFSQDKLSNLKKDWETQQAYLDGNYGLRSLVQAFLSQELSSCNLEDYKLEDISLFDKYGTYNNRYHMQLEKQLIQKNLYSGNIYIFSSLNSI